MKNNILMFCLDSLVLIESAPKEIGSEIQIDLTLPIGAVIENLPLEGTLETCRPVAIEGGNVYLLEVNVQNLAATDRLILQAYMNFQSREKELDQVFAKLKFKCIGKERVECEEENLNDKAILEYLNARFKNIAFN